MKRALEELTEPAPKKSKDHHMVQNLKAVMANQFAIFLSGSNIFLNVKSLGLMKIFSKEIPDYQFGRKNAKESPELYTITLNEEFTQENILNLVVKLQITGAACVLNGNKEDRYLGLVLWALALKLKLDHRIPEYPRIDRSPSQKLVFREKNEITNLADIQQLMKQRRKHWTTQAIFVTQRICVHHDMFPNMFVVEAFYNTLLKGYKTRGLTPEKALDNAMLLIEMFALEFKKKEDSPKEMLPVMVSAMKDFSEIVKIPSSNGSFQKVMAGLRLCASLHVKLIESCQADDLILQAIRNILTRVVQLPDIEERELANCMHAYIATYKRALPNCLVFHSPDFTIFKSIVNDRSFLNQEWIPELNDFVNRRPVPGVRPLSCIAASEIKKLGFKEQLEQIPKVLLPVLFHH